MIYNIVLLFLAFFGIAETTYLITKRKKQEKPICVGKDDCNLVLQSAYNKTFGLHNDVLGLVFYIFSACVMAVTFTRFIHMGPLAGLLTLAYLSALIVALVMSARFVYLMAFKLKTWCQWCVGSAVTVMFMAIVAVFWFLNGVSA